MKNLKRRWPQLYSDWLAVVGGFHEHAHFMFAIIEGYWHCLMCMKLGVIHVAMNAEETGTHRRHKATPCACEVTWQSASVRGMNQMVEAELSTCCDDLSATHCVHTSHAEHECERGQL